MKLRKIGIVFDPAKTKAKSSTDVQALIEKCIGSGVQEFLCGPASAAEISTAEYILSQKQSGVSLECVIPFEDVAAVWDEDLRDRFFEIMEKCEKETLLRTRYSDDAIFNKNEYITLNTDMTISLNE